jgi:hypothetical protein
MGQAASGVDQGWRPAPQAAAVGHRMATGYNREDKTMTAQEFAAKLEALIVEARAGGVPDEDIVILLQDAADGLESGLT